MQVKIKKSILSGTLVARPSKSFAHRYLFAACLSKGESTISNIDFSDDIKASLNCINAYGRKHIIDYENRKVIFKNEYIESFEPTFDCKESGTTLRIFMPIALEKYEKSKFIGAARLLERGIDVYEDIFKSVIFNKDKYSITTIGKIGAGEYNLPGNVSSQYISGLLYALPLMESNSKINITTDIESKNYILMTLEVLRKYGIVVNEKYENGNLSYEIPGGQVYKHFDAPIEGDYSNIAFIDAFNYFGSDIKISGLNSNSLQSDKIYKEYFEKLNEGFCELDIANCIDLGPILITFACLKSGGRFINTRRLRIKESDRGFVIASELKKCGADILVSDNEIVVNKKELSAPNLPFDSHNDHRIAMSLSLLSAKFDIIIEGAECVNKSYPSYFDDIKKLGGMIESKE